VNELSAADINAHMVRYVIAVQREENEIGRLKLAVSDSFSRPKLIPGNARQGDAVFGKNILRKT